MSGNSIIKKYNTVSAPVKASLWFTLCNIIQKGIALFTTPIFTRILTTEQYGLYTIYQSWHSIIMIFATLNMYMGVYNNGLTKYKDDKDGYSSSILGLSTLITFTLFCVVLSSLDWWSNIFQLPSFLLLVIFVHIFFETAFYFWSAKQKYDYKYKALIVSTLLIAVMNPVLGVVFVYSSEYKAEARIVSTVLVQCLIGLVCFIAIMFRGKKCFSKVYWKHALSFSLPLIPHYLAGTILNQADRLMIADMVGKEEAAIYGVAYTMSMMMSIVTNAINNTLIPYTYKEIEKNNYNELRKNTQFILLLVAGICIMAIIFCPELIRIFASEEYYNAIWVMPPIAASVFFMFLYPLFGNIEFYFEKTKFVAIASSIAAGINVILNYIFIDIFGYYAAGYTTLLCYIIYTLMHYLFYKKVLRDNKLDNVKIYNEKFIVFLSILILLFMLIMVIIYKLIVLRYIIFIILLSLFISKRNLIVSKLKSIKINK